MKDFKIDVASIGPFGEKTKITVTHIPTGNSVTLVGDKHTTDATKAMEKFKKEFEMEVSDE